MTRAGREFKACCPFHKEKTPSFTINDDKQFYHCFGCGAHGDVINFVMQHDNLPFPEAIERLAAQAGMEVPKMSAVDSQKAKEQKDLYTLMGEAAKFFEDQLSDARNADMMNYVLGRGISAETISAFHLGFAPADAQALRKHLSLKGYSDQQMMEVGLVKEGKEGRDPYVFFRERIMVPVIDKRGRVIAFGGRVLPDNLRPPDRGGYTPAKYMNSAETPIFNKSRVLYGAPQARQAATDETMFVVEGYFDVIACHQAGFKGAVAPMGTALTDEQIMQLWKMIPSDLKEPVLCFDGDNAGRRAAERACESVLPLISAGKSVRIAFLPDGEDPDSLIQSSGRSAFDKILNNAISLIDFLWMSHTAGRTFETPEQRAALVKTLNDQVAKIADRDVQKHYDYLMRQKISDYLFQKKQNRNNNWSPKGNRGGYGGQKPQGIALRRPGRQSFDVQTRILIAALINHPRIWDFVEEQIAVLPIVNERLDQIRQSLVSIFYDGDDHVSKDIENVLREKGFSKDMDLILSDSTYIHGRFSAPAAKFIPNEENKKSESDHLAEYETALQTIKDKWLSLFETIDGAGLEKEMKSGWKNAFQTSDAGEEERLKQILLDKKAQPNT